MCECVDVFVCACKIWEGSRSGLGRAVRLTVRIRGSVSARVRDTVRVRVPVGSKVRVRLGFTVTISVGVFARVRLSVSECV